MSAELVLLLADGRWPGGGSSHSGGVEAAVADGSVGDRTSLGEFVRGRLATVGLTEAWLAAGACAAWRTPQRANAVLDWDAECAARTPSAALRNAGRALGRGLRRVATQCWPEVAECRAELQPIVLGVVAATAGLAPLDAARLALHGALFGPLNAAPKLFAIDTAEICAIAVGLAPLADELAVEAERRRLDDDPPAWSAPLLEHRAEAHARWEVRLFAS